MIDFSFEVITGVMLGIEFPDLSEVDEDIAGYMVLDLFVFRLMFIKWKKSA